MPPLLNRLWRRVRATVAPVPDISATLWLQTVQRYPFLAALSLHCLLYTSDAADE